MGGGGYDICVLHRVLVLACCDQTCDVRHINEQICADFLCNLCKLVEMDGTRVSGSTCNDHLRLVLDCLLANVLIVSSTP